MIDKRLFKRFNISKEEFKKLSPVDQLNFRYRYNDIKEELNFDSILLPVLKILLILTVVSAIGYHAFPYSEVLVKLFANVCVAVITILPFTLILLISDIFVQLKAKKLYSEYTKELINDYFEIKPTTVKKKRVINGKSKSK